MSYKLLYFRIESSTLSNQGGLWQIWNTYYSSFVTNEAAHSNSWSSWIRQLRYSRALVEITRKLVLPHGRDELFQSWLGGAWLLHNVLAGRKPGRLPVSLAADLAWCEFCRQMRGAELLLLRKRDGRASGQSEKLLKKQVVRNKRHGLPSPCLLIFSAMRNADVMRLPRFDTLDIPAPTRT